jgi:hypothetical protein
LAPFSTLSPSHENLRCTFGNGVTVPSTTAATLGIFFFARMQQPLKLSLIANDMSIATAAAGTYTSSPAAPSDRMRVVAFNTGVAAAPAGLYNSISPLAAFSATVIPIDGSVTPVSANTSYCHF